MFSEWITEVCSNLKKKLLNNLKSNPEALSMDAFLSAWQRNWCCSCLEVKAISEPARPRKEGWVRASSSKRPSPCGNVKWQAKSLAITTECGGEVKATAQQRTYLFPEPKEGSPRRHWVCSEDEDKGEHALPHERPAERTSAPWFPQVLLQWPRALPEENARMSKQPPKTPSILGVSSATCARSTVWWHERLESRLPAHALWVTQCLKSPRRKGAISFAFRYQRPILTMIHPFIDSYNFLKVSS